MAQTTIKTANQIIDLALRRIGNTTIVEDAQAELNNILDRLYADFKWPFLKQTATGTVAAGDSEIALPSDFIDLWDRQSFHLTQAPVPTNGSAAWWPVTTISQQELDAIWYRDFTTPPDDSTCWGAPGRVLIDYNNLTFTLYPWPNRAYDYEIVYRAKYVQITNFDLPVNFPNEALLTQLLFAWACQFEDDERAMQEMALGEKLLRQFLKSFNQGTGKNNRMMLQPTRFGSMGFTR